MKGGARLGSGRKPANFDRNRARKLKQEGFSHKEIADRFGVSKWSIDWFFRKEKNESKSVGD